jgi:hypothetical protein
MQLKNWPEKKSCDTLEVKKVAASDVLPQLFLASKKTSKNAARTSKAQKELRRSSNFKKKLRQNKCAFGPP